MEYVKIESSAVPGEFLLDVCHTFNISKNLAQILVSRGIDTKEKIEQFLNPHIGQLHDPFCFVNMTKVVERIKKAKEQNESVVVFGDYDVDGICATYILISHLEELGLNVKGYIPHRIADGYGMTEKAILEVKEKYNCSLIISVDCGISCVDEVEFAKKHGVEIIVTDHHIVPEEKPDTLIINPKENECGYPFDSLCGAGVALKIVHALSGTRAVEKYLPAAALATIADIVPLTCENRAIVKLGLASAKRFLPIGVKKLMDLCGVKKLSAQAVSFKIAPKINAPGRLGDSDIVLELFLEKDEVKATALAEEIMKINSKRQEIGASIFDDVSREIAKLNIAKHKCFVLKNENWEAGLLGIACAKASTDFNRPTFLFSVRDGTLKGSVRSIEGINIVDVLTRVKKHVLSFGGHEMAAGLTVDIGQFEAFKAAVERVIEEISCKSSYKSTFEYDIEILENELHLSFAKELQLLEPTGCDNPPPVFKTRIENLTFAPSKNSREHLVLTSGRNKYLCFNGLKFVTALEQAGSKALLLELNLDEWNGKAVSKIIVRHIKNESIADNQNLFDGIATHHILHAYGHLGKIREYEEPEINEFGSVYISHNHKNAHDFAKEHNLKIEAFTSYDYNSESLVLIAPLCESHIKTYQKIWFIDDTIPLEFAHEIACMTGTQVYVKSGFKSFVPQININREEIAKTFKYIKENAHFTAASVLHFYNRARLEELSISFSQFAFCLAVFEELGFIAVDEEKLYFKVTMQDAVKKDLSESKIYQRFVDIKKTSC